MCVFAFKAWGLGYKVRGCGEYIPELIKIYWAFCVMRCLGTCKVKDLGRELRDLALKVP